MKIDADLITLVAVLATFALGLIGWLVAYRAMDLADRSRKALVQALHRAAQAGADAARWKTMAGSSVVDPRITARAVQAELALLDEGPASSTLTMPRVNERHIVPVSQGGRFVQEGYTDGT